jgi:DNA-binding HxlR family transcriptional regulator
MVKRSTIKRRSRSAASVSLDIFGDRWSLVIVRDLMLGGYRTFGDFLDGAEGIATNIPADRLAKLKTAGVLASRPVAGDRRKVHYRLTNKGVSLAPILVELLIWFALMKASRLPFLPSLAMRGRHALLEEIYCRWRRDDTTPPAARI